MQSNQVFALLAATISVAVSTTAFAGVLTDRADDVASRLRSVENRLSRNEIRIIGESLRRIEDIIGAGNGGHGDTVLVCVSNGQPGGFEQFVINDLSSGQNIGGFTAKATCDRLIAAQVNGLVCASNGQPGGFEKFSVYDSDSKRMLGGETAMNTCFNLTSKASSNLVCVSNGQPGGFEKFTLTNRNTGQALGGETALQTCLSSVR